MSTGYLNKAPLGVPKSQKDGQKMVEDNLPMSGVPM